MIYRALIAVVFCASFSTLAEADYLCRSGYKPLSAQQQDMHIRATAAMRAALLPPPAGWAMYPPTVSPNIGQLCGDFKSAGLQFSTSVTYVMRPNMETVRRARAAQNVERAEILALEKIPAEPQARIDEMNAAASARRQEGRELARAGDSAGAKNKTAEYEALGVKIRKIRADHRESIQAQSSAVRAKYRAEIELMNHTQISLELVGNGLETSSRSAQEGVERIQFGPNGKVQVTDRVMRVVATLEGRGTNGVAGREIVKGLIDRRRIEALVNGTLPSIEESNAAIAQQETAIAALETAAREQQKTLDNEERQARQTRSASASSPQSGGATAANPGSTEAPATAPTTAPSATAPTSAAPAAKPANDTAKDVKDAANKLRGLFGR